MSESKTPRTRAVVEKHFSTPVSNREAEIIEHAEKIELELNEANEAFHVNAEENIQYRKALTTAQQDLAKIAKALRTQQQRYHDLSEEVDGLKRDKERLDEFSKFHVAAGYAEAFTKTPLDRLPPSPRAWADAAIEKGTKE